MKIILATLAVCVLSGCSAIKGLTGPDGKPVTLPPVCYTSSAGQTCYNPDGSVTFTPAPAPPAPLPVQLEK